MLYTLVTGASSGVGRELAIYLSKTKPLIINGRNEKRLLETKKCCDSKCNIIVWPYDLNNIHFLESEFTEWIKNHNIAVDSLVYCAGLMKMVPLRAINETILHSTFYINTFAPFLLTKILTTKRVNEKNLKAVVYISSNISNRGAASFSVYGSSKAALDGLMRSLAVELAPDVRINSILPGGMITEMTNTIFENERVRLQFERNYPLGIGTPANIAPVVEFLLSDKAAWITGQQITVDGGRTIDITERGVFNE